ncbi:MAG: hypothetical protein JO166_08555, partial [Deltaproteobacteria bacterium]|nr:hypothetical protein [Deltaproteobacteria bacterium]
MSEALGSIFTHEIFGRLQKSAANSRSAEFRLQILSPCMSNRLENSPEHDQLLCEQIRERWNRWIASALSVGMFEEPHGAELKSRLTGIDDDGFRSALAECMTCWAFSSELGLPILPRPSGRGGRVLEFGIQTSHGEISLEVKAPRLRGLVTGPAAEQSASGLYTYSVTIAMRAALRSANRQFARARRNLLVIALPEIEEPVGITSERWLASLIKAFYGEQHLISAQPEAPPSQSATDGNFLKRPGGVPRFTRISAVVGLGEFGRCPDLHAAVLHNPYSEKPVDLSIFGEWMQFVAENREIRCFRA